MFSIKKCKTSSCVCKPPRLPVDVFDSFFHLPDPIPDGEHYKDFKSLYGKVETTEEHRPSLKEVENKSSSDKWRLIYCKNVLNSREKLN